MAKRIAGFSGGYRFLSNFFIEPDGTFVEYEYQRAKCSQWSNREEFDKLMATRKLTPKMAKALGRDVDIRPNWEDVKVNIMLFYVTKKFKDHADLRTLLEMTFDAYLEETNTWGDTYWGVCNGKGQNMLGAILMQVRSEL